jgi:hypothetical protein
MHKGMFFLEIFFFSLCSYIQGTTKLRNENETKRNETKNEETKRNEMKYHKTKRNTTKRNMKKRNKVSQNETKYIKQSIKDPKNNQ